MRCKFVLFVTLAFVVLLVNMVIGQGGQCEYGVPSDEFSKYEFEDDFTDSADGNDGSSADVGFVDGKVGKAGDFSGGAKVVIVPDSDSLGGMDEFVIGAWVYADSLADHNTIGSKVFSYFCICIFKFFNKDY